MHTEIAIIGSGPAGFTAAIYAGRASLGVVIFEGIQPGGQLTITTDVENYPGFDDGIMGPELMEVFRKQAQRFGAVSKYETIESVETLTSESTSAEAPSARFKLTNEKGESYTADAVIVATGATAKLLDVEGESTYMGFGVSACATCDGFFFKEMDVFVVGGGDTAMEEANYLTRFAKHVTIIHRREEFRASKIMLERAKANPKISFMLNSVVEAYIGEEVNGMKKLTHLRIKDAVTGDVRDVAADGAFVAIGHQPNTSLFTGVLDMDDVGYILTKDRSTYTNVPGIFACGDAQDSVYRQAVTAAGSGCMAAIDAERWLEAERHAGHA